MNVNDQFSQIIEQIHEIRNFLSPLDLKLVALDHEITKSRISFETKTSELESKIASNSSEIAKNSERIRRIELFLKLPEDCDCDCEKHLPAPVHEDKDKLNPAVILPPQSPA
ncbi:MAG: hypothetical protein ACREFE_00655 [Limisphaerales bacterium]